MAKYIGRSEALAYLIFTQVLLGIRLLDDHFVIDWHDFKLEPSLYSTSAIKIRMLLGLHKLNNISLLQILQLPWFSDFPFHFETLHFIPMHTATAHRHGFRPNVFPICL